MEEIKTCTARCRTCRYRWQVSETEVCCGYFCITGRRRPCPPGAGCTEYIRDERAAKERAQAPRQRQISWDTDHARRLWQDGATDQEIADAVGASKDAVRHWRQRRQMRCNQGPRGPQRTWDTERARELWAQGYMDREIGEAVGAGKKAIQHWRDVEGLPANGRAGRAKRER